MGSTKKSAKPKTNETSKKTAPVAKVEAKPAAKRNGTIKRDGSLRSKTHTHGNAIAVIGKALNRSWKALAQIATESGVQPSYVARVIREQKWDVEKRAVAAHTGVGRKPIELRRVAAEA